jgi:tRNA(Arg) A34 adenosine deaminase TadA
MSVGDIFPLILVSPRALLAGGCFGAVIVKNGKIVGEGYNNVISNNDPTW